MRDRTEARKRTGMALDAMRINTSAGGTGGIIYKLGSARLSVQASGNTLDISWPITGARLQAQTNGLGANWIDVPDSTITNRVVVPIGPATASVFYRLVLP